MDWKTLIEDNFELFVSELKEFLKIPSVSADPRFRDDVFECADWLIKALKEAGADKVELIPTERYPLVYAEKNVDDNAPTIWIYGHYDVQPPDPLDQWTTPPFEPHIRDGAIYARGASDDKGQLFIYVKALELLNETGQLKYNLRFLIEGEEEIGSPNLEKYIQNNYESMKGEMVLVSDTALPGPDKPGITVSLRGICYFEVSAYGPSHDLHSGTYGGAVQNPVHALAHLIIALRDPITGRIMIPGFYDDVEELSPQERDLVRQGSWNNDEIKASLNVDTLVSEAGFSPFESATIRPSMDVNGIWGGYIGEGSKTIIPAEAHAKISFRLVANQSWQKINEEFKKFVEDFKVPGIRFEVKTFHGGDPVKTPLDFWGYVKASEAMEKVFGKKPIPVYTGGSIPVLATWQRKTGMHPILMGFGLESDRIHAPDEHFRLDLFRKGIETVCEMLSS